MQEFGEESVWNGNHRVEMLLRNEVEGVLPIRRETEGGKGGLVYDTAGFSFIPVSCPEALIATIADFILSLEEVKIAVICSHRKDGIKLSVRSETAKAHAGELIREALKDIGNGIITADLSFLGYTERNRHIISRIQVERI